MVREGYERVMCERWVGDWTKTATYWPPALPGYSSTPFSSCGAPQPGALRAQLSAGSGSHCFEVQQLTTNKLNFLSHRVIWLFDTHLLPVSVTFAPNSTSPLSRLYPDIFDRMHLFLDWRLGQYVTLRFEPVTEYREKWKIFFICSKWIALFIP